MCFFFGCVTEMSLHVMFEDGAWAIPYILCHSSSHCAKLWKLHFSTMHLYHASSSISLPSLLGGDRVAIFFSLGTLTNIVPKSMFHRMLGFSKIFVAEWNTWCEVRSRSHEVKGNKAAWEGQRKILSVITCSVSQPKKDKLHRRMTLTMIRNETKELCHETANRKTPLRWQVWSWEPRTEN